MKIMIEKLLCNYWRAIMLGVIVNEVVNNNMEGLFAYAFLYAIVEVIVVEDLFND